ncbi:MAG: tetratricopeptide repeat protein [Deltaproteobacteria bacterium]|nr:tetratricopeptide repeat protein [Deltaproteobacteria bacterium]
MASSAAHCERPCIVAIDKNKIIEAATKFVQKGQYDKAIKEYQKLLEVDPKDARIQQKLGELHQKKGDNLLAADCFLKVAESYAADGFFLKAVAVYKQVLKLNPTLIEVNLKLAEIHQQMWLMSDAMAQYQLVANHYEKSGNLRASLDTLRKMVDLDPDNIASRIKLAELYAREGMNGDAIAEFSRAAEYLKRNNRVDDYIKVAERLVFLDANNVELTRELANIYLTKQDTKRALAKLQLCFKADPKDVETLNMLAQAFKDLGQLSKTVSVYKELAKIYAEQDRVDDEREVWKKIQDLVPDDPDARARMPQAAPVPIVPPVTVAPQPAVAPARAQPAAPRPSAEQIPRLLTETDVYVKYGLHEKAIEHLKKVFAIDPSSVDAHEKAADLFFNTGNAQAALGSLVKVVQLCIGKGDLDRARAGLQKLCEKEPSHPAIPDFLNAVGGLASAEEVAEIEEDAILVEAADEAIEVAPEPEIVAEDLVAHEPVSVGSLSEDVDDDALAAAAESLAASVEAQELVAEPHLDEEFVVAPQEDDELALSSAENSLLEPEAEPLVEPTSLDLEAPFVAPLDQELLEEPEAIVFNEPDDLVGPAPSEFETQFEEPVDLAPAEPHGLAGLGDPLEGPGALGGGELELRPTKPLRVSPGAQAWARPEANRHDEATRVAPLPRLVQDGETAQADAGLGRAPPAGPQVLGDGFEDEPTSVLPALQLGRMPAVGEKTSSSLTQPNLRSANEVLAQALVQKRTEAKPVVPASVVEPENLPSPEPEPLEPPVAEEPAGDELDEASFFIEQGMLEEAREIVETVLLAYPSSQRAKELLGRLEEAESGASRTTDEQPLPEEPAATDGAFDLASELAKEDLGALEDEPAIPATDDFQVSVEDVFGEFKKGLKKVVKPEDVETHYDLGIAYKEMGLLEDAIGEFEQASAAATGKKKENEALAMVGLCRAERSEWAESVEAFERALTLPQATPDISKAVHFELALTLERMGRAGESLHHFQKVQSLDSSFRNVGEAITRLIDSGAEAERTEPALKALKVPTNGSSGAARVDGRRPDDAAGPGEPTAPREPPDPKGGKKARKIGYL